VPWNALLRAQTSHADSAQRITSQIASIEEQDRQKDKIGGKRRNAPPVGVKSLHAARFGLQDRIRTGDLMADVNSGGVRRPDPNEKLVKVFDSELESEAIVVKGLLDSAGIDSDLTSASLVQDAFPGLGGMIILVREEDAEDARRVIAEGQSMPDDEDDKDDETAEIEIIEEPPQKM
jgi:hypothetical protein